MVIYPLEKQKIVTILATVKKSRHLIQIGNQLGHQTSVVLKLFYNITTSTSTK